MLATYLSLKGKKVDIVTSSSNLAVRDSEEYKAFYSKFFNFTCAHNI